MTNAYRDENSVPTIIASSSVDGKTPIRVYADPTTHRLLVDTSSGAGITSINTDSTQAQTLTVGTTGTDFAIVDNGSGDHKFNLPDASATARGVITTGTQTIAGTKTFSSTITADISGNAATATSATTATTATNATNTAITNDTTTNATMYPTWVTANTGNLPQKVSSTGFIFNPSSGRIGAGAMTLDAGVGLISTADASFDVFGTTNAIIHAHNVGAQSTTAGAAIIGYAIPVGAAMTTGNRLSAFVGGGSNDATNTMANATAVASFATENWTSSVNGAKMLFEVTANGATSRSAALTLDQDKSATFASTASATQLISTIATGTAPLAVTSTTPVTNLSIGGNAATVTGLSFTAGKTLSVSNILTLAGTDSTTMTFPTTSASVARTDAAQTFTGTQTFSQVITTNNAIAASSNAATVPITSKINTVTNNSAATLTITMTTTSAVDGQLSIVRILDSSAAAQTIAWVNTENSTVSAPTTSNGSTTLPLTVGFQYNGNTSLWRCIAKA